MFTTPLHKHVISQTTVHTSQAVLLFCQREDCVIFLLCGVGIGKAIPVTGRGGP
jgi:hypothetical protein